jgi:hypothetical protein
MNYVHLTGPESIRDCDGNEIPEWSVFVADHDGEKRRSKIYRVRNFERAAALANVMGLDRHLLIQDHCEPA